MAKPKAKTFQQQLGFFDYDLKKPEHDAILKWVDINIDEILNDVYNINDWSKSTVNKFQKKSIDAATKNLWRKQQDLTELESTLNSIKKEGKDDEANLYVTEAIDEAQIQKKISSTKTRIDYLNNYSGIKDPLPIRDKYRTILKKWEYPVSSQNSNYNTGYISKKFIIGFVDILVRLNYSKLTIEGLDLEDNYISSFMKWGQTGINLHNTGNILNVYIEVKTEIKSLGELFRQLNTYKEYLKGEFLVICPDDTNREIIEQQGFKFYKIDITRL